VRPASVREFVAAGSEQTKVTTSVKIRYIAGIVPSMRIRHGDRLYAIEGVLPDPVSGREYLTLPCSEVIDG
jgi:SPP1 family predicted phage head-tail adaptor